MIFRHSTPLIRIRVNSCMYWFCAKSIAGWWSETVFSRARLILPASIISCGWTGSLRLINDLASLLMIILTSLLSLLWGVKFWPHNRNNFTVSCQRLALIKNNGRTAMLFAILLFFHGVMHGLIGGGRNRTK